MANQYLKPQKPLKDLNSEDYFYPLTTSDQIFLSDTTTRLNSLLDHTNFTASRAIYYNGTKLLSSNNIFLNDNQIAINKTSITSGYNFEVNGVSSLLNRIDFNHTADGALLRNYYDSTWYNLIRNHNNGNISLSASSSGLYVGYENTILLDFLHGKMTFKNDRYCLNIHPSGGSFADGIRIYHRTSDSSWSGITLVGNDLTAETGTSANTWFFGNNKGSLFISRNGSGESGTGYLRSYISNSAGYWKIGQRVGINGENNGYQLYINGNTLANGSYVSYSTGSLISNVMASVWPYWRIDTRAGESERNSAFNTYTSINQDTWAQVYYQLPLIRKTYADATSTTVTATYQYPAYWFFRQYSPNSNGTRTAYYEDFYLPATDVGRTNTAGYKILTTKNLADGDSRFVTLSTAQTISGAKTFTTEIKITKNGNTLTIGSLNTSWCHFENSANIPFYFGRQVQANNSFKIYNNNTILGAGYLELYGGTPYVDFHFNNSTADYTSRIIEFASGSLRVTSRLYNAVWNDYAEFRKADIIEPGYVVKENGDGSMSKAEKRMELGAKIISDTYGISIGQNEENNTPIAVSGRVLVYPYQNKEKYKPGMSVCAAPGGTVDIMTREEIREYPDAIIGIVSEIPNYDIWYAGNYKIKNEKSFAQKSIPIKVNGRIWVYVR